MMHDRRHQTFAALIIGWGIAVGAYSQNAAIPTVSSEGVATERTAATSVAFILKYALKDETRRAAAEKALAFPARVRNELSERKLRTQSVEDSGVEIPSLHIRVSDASISVRVRFSIVRFSSDDDKTKAYASLCDDMAALARDLECTIFGPTLEAEDPELVEQEAIARATENALYQADAVAPLLESQIFAVQAVEVLEVKWLTGSGSSFGVGALTRRCYARVRVVYTLAALR